MTLNQAAPAAPSDARQSCILVVEDELLIRLLLSEELRDQGHRVIEACNADEALVLLDAHPPDLIVTDVRMPGSIDGLGLLKRVREAFPALPVIVMSGHLQSPDALAEGAAAFVPKPFAMDVMAGAVRIELTKAA